MVTLEMLDSDSNQVATPATVIPPPLIPATPDFMGIPVELREKIIGYIIENARVPPKEPHEWSIGDGTELLKWDFSVNALGSRCHSMESFPIIFVNKQVHLESLAVLYRLSTVVLYAEVTNDTSAFGYIPSMLGHISPSLTANVRALTVRLYNVAPPSKPGFDNKRSCDRVRLRDAEESSAKAHLQELVDFINKEFTQRSSLVIIAGIRGALPPELKILFGLLAVPDEVVVTLVELWQTNDINHYYGVGTYNHWTGDAKRHGYNRYAQSAAKSAGQQWLNDTRFPDLVQDGTMLKKPMMSDAQKAMFNWSGIAVEWARHRCWKRRAKTSCGLPSGA
ncbi:uncharacterized protein L3040_006800 [Drepanopeziza brunnea f. sp. 'multigermtubi']|uniref:Uncharacterized protein n=1 Tax=Marssonina brunnea f. sp. multigermtubi (strain MB_m1) TaxID=1072389 RepID=K1WP06_MARBU|nr:uncharacterized protein MBM_02652 [Drepanopeziza brunnea f. sp. 'multigermtubi' MB_m1]EKD19415.1 hypothetical protein MBM_02652 [Drepanopeziza brunnea f. sp. 'multigermtubi' MB_m1]KAJ5037924.1 hypothetical protein L3040_006800 [Drepanopeziza brunnea f. sp. 'multigermtubi']